MIMPVYEIRELIIRNQSSTTAVLSLLLQKLLPICAGGQQVARDVQAVVEAIEKQRQPANVVDMVDLSSINIELDHAFQTAETLEARKTIRQRTQSWMDWFYEKTVTKAATTIGLERLSQRQIDDRVDETFERLERNGRADDDGYGLVSPCVSFVVAPETP